MSIPFGVHVPFIEHLGFTLERFEGGESELRYSARPEHLNSFSVTHGGACMALLDVAMAAAARSVQPDMGVVTIEMKTSFMQPATGPLVAKGRACTHATGTFKYVKRLPVGASAVHPLQPPLSTD